MTPADLVEIVRVDGGLGEGGGGGKREKPEYEGQRREYTEPVFSHLSTSGCGGPVPGVGWVTERPVGTVD